MLQDFDQITVRNVIYLKETPEQREGAFSNFRISPVTINKLKGEYESDIFYIQCSILLFQMTIVAVKEWQNENSLTLTLNVLVVPFCFCCLSFFLSSGSLLPVWHSGKDIWLCLWWWRCNCPGPNRNREDILVRYSFSGETPERFSRARPRSGPKGTGTILLCKKTASLHQPVRLCFGVMKTLSVGPGLDSN